MEEQILPTYEEIAFDQENLISNLEYKKLITEISNQREERHREVDNAINQMEKEIGEIKVKHHSLLQKHLNEIKQVFGFVDVKTLSSSVVDNGVSFPI